MHRVVFAALATILAILAGAARAELASRTEERGAVRIAVLGDSLADGLWGSLYRKYYRDRRVKVFDLARASTGFNAHPYEEDLLVLLAQQDIDLLIVQAGANDRQRVIALDGNETARFGSARWFELYGQRLTLFLGIAQQRGIPVVWVGMPTMRDPAFDAGMRIISSVQKVHAERHGALYLDVSGFTADDEGGYAEYLTLPNGRKGRLRHQDGVHSWELGYDRLAAYVAEAVRARFPGLLPDR